MYQQDFNFPYHYSIKHDKFEGVTLWEWSSEDQFEENEACERYSYNKKYGNDDCLEDVENLQRCRHTYTWGTDEERILLQRNCWLYNYILATRQIADIKKL